MFTSDISEQAVSLTKDILGRLFTGEAARSIGVRLWDGSLWPDDRPHAATLVLRHPGALRAMLLPGTELALAEAYLYDDCDMEGDIESILGVADDLAESALGWRQKVAVARDLARLPARARQGGGRRGPARLTGRRHSLERDRQAVTYHYDVSNEFYGLWLDSRMVYSCAYFRTLGEDLDTAQEHKLDYICRKLRLAPGQRLLDIGCGWGGLVIYAAEHHGVDATGITLSRPQAELANQRIAAANLSDRCRVEVRDYRQVDEPEGYDALASVGMFEHVGATRLPPYFALAWRLLKPGGCFVNHGIASRAADKPQSGTGFSDTYVFPDGQLTPISVTLQAAEQAGFEVRDVESLREHYALTLRHWVRRLEAHHGQALQFVDEPTYRVWRLFMSGSAHGFSAGRLNVYQALLVKPDAGGHSGMPLTRAAWYVDEDALLPDPAGLAPTRQRFPSAEIGGPEFGFGGSEDRDCPGRWPRTPLPMGEGPGVRSV
jgi:cyclopropane-fatty-acyl-phospholipid synthase